MKRTFLIATLITLIFISSAQAAKWAILVGVDDYENPEINKLRCAVADVTEFKKALLEVGEFEPDNIFLMTDKSKGEKRPTNTNILYKVGTLAEIMEPQDTFIFYFSGHGMMRGGKAFLLSINADPRSVDTLELSGVPMDKLRERMNKIKARQVLFIVDACRNDPSAGRGDKDNLLTDDFARIVRVMPGSRNSGVPSATATLYSCSKGERAYEYHQKGQGAFSYFLIQGLRGDEAVDRNGNITINLLADYTQRAVTEWAKRRNKKQTPWLIQEGAGKIVLAPTRPDIVRVTPTAQLEISTLPAGAEIYIDQILYGVTPKIVEIDLGIQEKKEVEVALTLGGYRTKIARVTARRGRKSRWTGVELEPTVPPPKYSDKDSMKMVYIPAGTFMMGSNDGGDNEKPVHEVYTDAFYMDEHEVTNEQYCKFLNSISVKDGWARWLDSSGNSLIYNNWEYCYIEKSGSNFKPKSGYEKHPVVSVYWEGADAYAKWVGGRLPTEAEWERAARGGLVGKKYPNGDSISHNDANYKGTGGKDLWGGEDLWEQTAPVKNFAPNGYGLYDMAGNVYEWCSDYWDKDYYSKSPQENPTGPSSGIDYVIRGGGWRSDSSRVRCGYRSYYRIDSYGLVFSLIVGFRVVVASEGL